LSATNRAEPTFGIITALPIEFAAVKAMLESPEPLRAGGRTARQYLEGAIPAEGGGFHLVVVALLPSMANNSASARASLLLEDFPSVRHILMVGIAGGAPHPTKSDEHVRLGDIVVSGTQGIVQYDFVAEKIDEVVHRSPPRPPSAALLEAVRLLQAEELVECRPWLPHLPRATQLRGSARPPDEEDRLAATPPVPGWVPHPQDPARRPAEPRVFVGTIGSANLLLRNPVKRDLMRDQFQLRAFEMEGSGVADGTWLHDTGYLVIRGICDYCDANKNDRWHAYAAVVAAAYTRALLESMPASPARNPLGQGRSHARKAPSFLEQAADTFRLMHYEVEEGKTIGGREVGLYLTGKLGDATISRVIDCLPAGAGSGDVDAFVTKLRAIHRYSPAATGTIVTGVPPAADVVERASADGISVLTLERLAAQLLDGTGYARRLVDELSSDEKYRPELHIQPRIRFDSTTAALNADEVLAEWLTDPTWNQLTLLGDVGTGKTFLSHILALKLAREYLKDPVTKPLPILVDLRNAARQLTLEGLISSHLQRHHLEKTTFSTFQHVLAAGRIILILDGFDEMAARVTPAVTNENFSELVKCVVGRAKVLLTCRTHYFKSRADEEELILGAPGEYESQAARELYWDLVIRKGFKIAYLSPFDISQIEEYVERARPSDAKQAIARMRRIYDLMELSRRPMLLDMIVKSVDKIRGDSINAATLYQVFTDVWIRRDKWRDVLSPERKLALLTSLAMRLWTSDATSLHHRELVLHVEESGVRPDAARILEIDNEMRTASFLVREGDAHYRFAHKSYSEFFIARHLAAELDNGRVECLEQRQRVSPEVIGFLRDLIRNRDMVDGALAEVLTSEYRPMLSENALFVLKGLRQPAEGGHAAGDGSQVTILPEALRLAGAQLDGAALTNFQARRSCFRGASMRGATLSLADLKGSDFTGADLTGAGLQQADLSDVKFASAKLIEADFTDTRLKSTDFADADVHGAIMLSLPGAEGSASPPSLGKHQAATDPNLREVLEWVREASRRLSLRCGLDADDIEQRVMVRLYVGLDESPRHPYSRAMVQSLCRSAIYDELRKQSRLADVDQNLVDYAARHVPDPTDPEQELIERDFVEKLESVLESIPFEPRARMVFQLWRQGFNAPEIALRLKVSQTAVSRTLTKMRRLVQSAML
jgi:RNA polymerase sigma factor (sigma-70 family)